MVKKKVKKLTNQEEAIAKEIQSKKLSVQETRLILKGLKNHNSWQKYVPVLIDFPEKHIKFGVFSDSHIGHQDYRPDVLRKMIKEGKREGLEFWLNAGDTIEGMSGREGHIYELTHLGASAQLFYFAQEFKQFDIKIYSIEAQDSHGGWFHSKANVGLNIGEELARRSKYYKFIGYDEQDIVLENGLKIRLRHPGGGTAYALSYRGQKWSDSISGGKKPHIVFTGHHHKALYMFYRNIHYFEAGTLCNQTPFMRKIGTPAHVGYWIIDVTINKNGTVERIANTFIPFYE